MLQGVLKELITVYDKNSFKYKPENIEYFITVHRKVFGDDLANFNKLAEISLRNIKSEAQTLKYLCHGLEIFEALGIVKHETRRVLLGKTKTAIAKESFRFKDLIHLTHAYPNKIKTKAFEQLVELALQKMISKSLQPNVEEMIQLLI